MSKRGRRRAPRRCSCSPATAAASGSTGATSGRSSPTMSPKTSSTPSSGRSPGYAPGRRLDDPPMMPVKRLHTLISGFAGKKIVVVGDLIADEYLYGKPARISREAPVLILRFTEREVRLGGAANATDNVHALGAVATPIGVLGRDEAGQELTRLFAG